MEPATATVGREVFPGRSVRARSKQLARDIARDLGDLSDVVAVVVMDGAIFWGVDIMRELAADGHDVRYLFLRAASADGNPQVWLPPMEVSGRRVLLLEDLVNTGVTVATLTGLLLRAGAVSVHTCSMLAKPGNLKIPASAPQWVAESLGADATVVGYGLDSDGAHRTLDGVYELESMWSAAAR